jgi:hypothetical protein
MKNISWSCSLLISSNTFIIPLISQTDIDEDLRSNHITTLFVFVYNAVSSFVGATTVNSIWIYTVIFWFKKGENNDQFTISHKEEVSDLYTSSDCDSEV